MTSVNVTTTKNTVTVNGETRVVTVKTRGPQGPAFADGDIGDIVISGGGTVATIDNGVVNNAKIASNAAIALSKLATGALPTSITVTSANISDLSIVNADINASAAIAGTKIDPDFGSQTITTTGNTNLNGLDVTGAITSSGNITITNSAPSIFLTDTDNNPDYILKSESGQFIVQENGGTTKFAVNTDGHVDVTGNLDVGAGLDVTGNITVTGTVDGRDVSVDGTKLDGIETGATADQTASEIKTAYESNSDTNAFTDALLSKLNGIESNATADQTAAEIKTLLNSNGIVNAQVDASAAIAGSKINPSFTSDITISNTYPRIYLTDTNNNSDFIIINNDGNFLLYDATNTADRFSILANGTVRSHGNFDALGGLDVTGHATVSQSLTVTGTTSLGETVNITGNDPNITFVDSDNNPDFKIFGNGGTLNFVDSTSSANRLVINSDGHVDVTGNLDVGAGLDVTGSSKLFGNGEASVQWGDTSALGHLSFTATNGNPIVRAVTGKALVFQVNQSTTAMTILSNGNVSIGADIVVGGTVDGVDIQALNTTVGTKLPLAGGTITGDLTVGGNFTVNGTTTTIDTTTLTVEDKNIELGKVSTPTDTTADGGGITLLGATNKTFQWLDATDSWTSSEHIALPDDKKLILGTGSDLQIFHRSADNASILAEYGSGSFSLETNGSYITFYDSANNRTMARFNTGGACEFKHGATTRLITASDGISVTGNITTSGTFSSGSGSNQLNITHSGGGASKVAATGDLILQGTDNVYIGGVNDETHIKCTENDRVELYYDNAIRLVTTSTGIQPYGDVRHIDNIKATFGTSQDLEIFHDASDSNITNSTGVFFIQNAGDLRLRVNNTEAAVHCVANGAVELFYDNSKKFETYANGIKLGDNVLAAFGDDIDLLIHHTGSTGYIKNQTGNFYIQNDGVIIIGNQSASTTGLKFNDGGAIELSHNNSKKFETTSTGVSVTGDATISGGQLTLGAADTASGHLNAFELMTFNIDSDNDDTNRYFGFYKNGNSGSGTELVRITEDGHLQIPNDNAKLQIGAGQDFEFYHDSNNSIIANSTGSTFIKGIGGSGNTVWLQPKNNESSAKFNPDGDVELFYDNSLKFATTSTGIKVSTPGHNPDIKITGALGSGAEHRIFVAGSNSEALQITGNTRLFLNGDDINFRNAATTVDTFTITSNGDVNLPRDNKKLQLGASQDLQLVHNGSDTFIHNYSGVFFIRNTGDLRLQVNDTEAAVHCVRNGAVELFYDNSKKLETTSDGVDVTGELDVAGDFRTSTARGISLDIQKGANGSRTSVTLTFSSAYNGKTVFVEMFVGSSSYHLHHVSHRYHNGGLNVLTNDGTGCTVTSSISGSSNSSTYTYTVTFDSATSHPYARFIVSLGGYLLSSLTSPSISFGT